MTSWRIFEGFSVSEEIIDEMSEPIVKQLIIDGPAKGSVVERPGSEKSVYLPWRPTPVLVKGVGVVRPPVVTYLPFTVQLFGRTLWLLALNPPAHDMLFEMLVSDIGKELV